jgi:hypothetical protein
MLALANIESEFLAVMGYRDHAEVRGRLFAVHANWPRQENVAADGHAVEADRLVPPDDELPHVRKHRFLKGLPTDRLHPLQLFDAGVRVEQTAFALRLKSRSLEAQDELCALPQVSINGHPAIATEIYANEVVFRIRQPQFLGKAPRVKGPMHGNPQESLPGNGASDAVAAIAVGTGGGVAFFR